MIAELFKTECRRHLPLFGGLSLFSAVFGGLLALSGNDNVYAVLALLLRIGLGVFVPCYIGLDLKKSFFDRETRLPLLLPLRASVRFAVQAAVLGLWTLLLWACNQVETFLNPLGLYASRIAHSARPGVGMLYLLAEKSSAVVCGIALIGLGIALSLTIGRRRKLAAALQITLPLAACLLLLTAMSRYVPNFSAWMLGSTSTASYPQYAGLLAVTFENFGSASDIADTMNWTSAVLNGLTAIAALVIALPLLDSPKFEAGGERRDA